LSDSHPINPTAAGDGSLTCEIVHERDAVRLRPMGNLDVATGPVVERQLRKLVEAGFQRLIVDLGGLSFMDSTGLRLALKWDADARQDGFEIAFVPGPPAVQRVFELTGMSDRVTFIRS
jgi:anti-sigma B factor antagonist